MECMCYTTRLLEVGSRAHHAIENICNRGDIKCWVLKKYLFDTSVTLVLLYGVEVWGGGIPKSTWKEFENVQKHFLTKFPQVKKQTPYILLLLDTTSWPIESMAMERVAEYMLKFQKHPSHRLPRIAWEASKKDPEDIQTQNCVPLVCKRYRKMVWKVDCNTLDSWCIDSFLLRPCCNTTVSWHRKNMEAHASHITLHIMHLTTKPCSSTNAETAHINTC